MDSRLWKSQLALARVIPNPDSNSNVVKVSHDLVQVQRSDNDGDLLPIYFGNENIQTIIANHVDNQFTPTFMEENWFAEYYADEADASLFDKLKNAKYSLYEFSYLDFKKRLFDSAIAKTTVGVGTTQYWVFTDALDVYLRNYSGKEFSINDTKIKGRILTARMADELKALYAAILQTRVIGAIKHMENGSDSYSQFLLERLALSKGSDFQKISKLIIEDFPWLDVTKEDSSEEALFKSEIVNMFQYICAVMGKTRLGLFGDFNSIYSHYNGGKELPKLSSNLSTDTIFYEIVKLIDDWRSEYGKSLKTATSTTAASSFDIL